MPETCLNRDGMCCACVWVQHLQKVRIQTVTVQYKRDGDGCAVLPWQECSSELWPGIASRLPADDPPVPHQLAVMRRTVLWSWG